MNVQVEVDFVPGEGNVLRVLGVIERRGWAIESLRVVQTNEDRPWATMRLRCWAESGRPAVLERQLARAVVVTRAEVSQASCRSTHL